MTLKNGLYIHERIIEPEWNINKDQYEKWEKESGFSKTIVDTLAKNYNLSLDDFKKIISNDKHTSSTKKIEWISDYREIMHTEIHSSLDINYESEEILFYPFFKSYITYSENYLNLKLANLIDMESNRINWDLIKKNILFSLLSVINNFCLRTLISEINLASEQDLLEGDNAKERYNNFLKDFLSNPDYLDDLQKNYPLMPRLIIQTIHSSLDFYGDILLRFIQDVKNIEKKFNNQFSSLFKVELGAGDTHQGGKTVAILHFESGEKLVYKPRSLKMDQSFLNLLTWINEKKFDYPLQNVRVLDCGTYGWQEYVKEDVCETLNEVERFYFRQGGYIALFYILNSTDFHHENLIAKGEFPVFVDLETLFSNEVKLQQKTKNSYMKFAQNIGNSVFKSLMLPAKFSDDSLINYDLSGLGNAKQDLIEPSRFNAIDNLFTDKIRLTKKKFLPKEQANAPKFNGIQTNASEFEKEIIKGFSKMYSIFTLHREELLSNRSILNQFNEIEARQVFRPTEAYSRFLEAGAHPKYLKNGMARETLFNYLWHLVSFEEKYGEIVKYEVRDLLKNDVPYFTFKIDSTSLYTAEKIEIPHFFEETSKRMVEMKIRNLSTEDCFLQTEYIRLSLQTLRLNNHQLTPKYGIQDVKIKSDSTSGKLFIEEAQKIGDYLINQAFMSDDLNDAMWFGLNLDHNESFKLSPLGVDLYNGSLGIVLFLAILEQETNEEKYRVYAKAGLNAIDEKVTASQVHSLSAFSGIGALAYVYAYLGLLWNDEELIEKSIGLINKITTDDIKLEIETDFIGGLSGTLRVINQLLEKFPQITFADLAYRISGRIVEAADQAMSEGSMLTGLAHGASGYAMAIMELSHITSDTELWNKAMEILEYERKHYNVQENNWNDLRQVKQGNSPIFWCHGATGIGLSRVQMKQYDHEDIISQDLERALDKVLTGGFNGNHTLCHGDFGSIDFLITTSQLEGYSPLLEMARNLGSNILNSVPTSQNWNLDIGESKGIFGLMIGLSGIGYELLRLNNPLIPSVLTLDLPNKVEKI